MQHDDYSELSSRVAVMEAVIYEIYLLLFKVIKVILYNLLLIFNVNMWETWHTTALCCEYLKACNSAVFLCGDD